MVMRRNRMQNGFDGLIRTWVDRCWCSHRRSQHNVDRSTIPFCKIVSANWVFYRATGNEWYHPEQVHYRFRGITMKRKPRIAIFSILAVAVLFLLAQCDLLSPPIPPVVVDVSLTAFNIGAVTGIPGIQFGQYSAHLTDGTSWSSSSSGNSGVFDVELNSGTYNVVVTLNAPSAPVPAMSSLSVYTETSQVVGAHLQ